MHQRPCIGGGFTWVIPCQYTKPDMTAGRQKRERVKTLNPMERADREGECERPLARQCCCYFSALSSSSSAYSSYITALTAYTRNYQFFISSQTSFSSRIWWWYNRCKRKEESMSTSLCWEKRYNGGWQDKAHGCRKNSSADMVTGTHCPKFNVFEGKAKDMKNYTGDAFRTYWMANYVEENIDALGTPCLWTMKLKEKFCTIWNCVHIHLLSHMFPLANISTLLW